MKVSKFLGVAIILGVMISCNSAQKTNREVLQTEIDSVSYAIGVNMANQMNKNFAEVKEEFFIKGFKDGMDSTTVLLIQERFTSAVIRTYSLKEQERKEKLKKQQMSESNMSKFGHIKKEGEEFLAKNKTKKGVVTTASGFQYQIIKEGNGNSPIATDKIKVHYHGTTVDGVVFDSTIERNKPYELRVNQFVKGFSEGLKLMKVGSKYKFFIPQELAYGPQQRGEIIKPFSALVFEVELLEIKK